RDCRRRPRPPDLRPDAGGGGGRAVPEARGHDPRRAGAVRLRHRRRSGRHSPSRRLRRAGRYPNRTGRNEGMSEFAMDSMAYAVLDAAQAERDSLLASSRVTGYEALDRLAPLISCLKYGHPDQPARRLKRFRQRPWRCDRCATWWTTERKPEG